jgi:hypothetical protein
MSFIELIALQKPGVIKELTVSMAVNQSGCQPAMGRRNYLKRQQWKSIYSVFLSGIRR